MTAALLLWAGLARATDVVCDESLAQPPGQLSVAWVSPVRRGATNATWLEVVPTSELSSWIAAERPSVGRLLQRVGLRKRAKEPHRLYKVTIFEVDSASMCRPVEFAGAGEQIAGLPACDGGVGRATTHYSGCGYTTDHKTGARGLDVYRVQWRDAAARGFCVLPAQRFVEEAGR